MTKGGPVVVRVANCASVSMPLDHSRGNYVNALTKRGPYGLPHVVLAMECSDFDAELVAEFHQWEAVQYGATGSPQSGSVVAYDPERVALRVRRLVETSPAGDGVRARYTVRTRLDVNGHREWFNAGHAPPDRSQGPQAAWYRRAHQVSGILGADFNDRPDFMAPRFGRTYVGARGDVLGLLVPTRIPASTPKRVDIGSDHVAVDVVLWPDQPTQRKEK